MSPAFNIIYAAIVAEDPDLLTIIRDNWKCLLGPDEKRLIKVLHGVASSLETSEGGFDAEDSGKVATFAVDGSLSLTNRLTIYEGINHTDYWAIDTSGVDGERDVSVINASGRLPLYSIDAVPPVSATAGKAGMFHFDSDFLYVCVADGEWKRADLSAF